MSDRLLTVPGLLLLAVIIAVAGSSSPPGTVVAAGTIVVNSFADTVADDSACTLREAILAAQEAASNDDCGTGDFSGADTITFDTAAMGGSVITLRGTQFPVITSAVTIDGDLDDDHSPDITIDANHESRHFEVSGDGELTITGLILENGNAITDHPLRGGGSILNIAAFLHIEDSIFRKNKVSGDRPSGGAIESIDEGGPITGSLTVVRTSFENNGGGDAYDGGAIDVTRMPGTIADSTFTGNQATEGGGAIWANGPLTVTNSTFSANGTGAVGGSLQVEGLSAPFTLNNATLVEGSLAASRGTVTNTILDTCEQTAGVTFSASIATDDSCGEAGITIADLMLGGLADNGGTTQTHLPKPGSPAIDAGDNTACPTVDQRGAPRHDSACDIGSIERQPDDPVPSEVVTTIIDQANYFGSCTLRDAITANLEDTATGYCLPASDGVIRFAAELDDEATEGDRTIVLNGSHLPDITGEIAIDGGEEGVTIDADRTSRHFEVRGNGDLTLTGLTIQQGFADPNRSGGGAIYNEATLTVVNSTLMDNSAHNWGGAILNLGTATIVNSTLSGNTAGDAGGAILGGSSSVNLFTQLTIINSTIANNTGASGGGIRSANGSTITIHNTLLADNSGANCSTFTGSLWHGTAGSNLSDDATCTGDGFDTGLFFEGDADLDALGDYGGPTPTHMLLATSPALDAGDNAICPATDQRGEPRPVNATGLAMARCDIGAVELQTYLGPDLALTKTVDRAVGRQGDVLAYTLGVENTGASPAANVIITDTLPAGLTFSSVIGPCSAGGQVVTCPLGNVASGGSASVEIHATVDADVADAAVLTNTATVTSDRPEAAAVRANNTASVATTIRTPQDLSIAKVLRTMAARAGDTVRYDLTITNDAPDGVADNVVVTDRLPDGTSFVSAEAPAGWTCDEANGRVTCTTEAMTANTSALIVLRLQLADDARGQITNTASVASDDTDPDAGNNTDSASFTVLTGPPVPQRDITPPPTAEPTDTATATPSPTAEPTETPTATPTAEPGTYTYDLSFRWTLITWYGADGVSPSDALRGDDNILAIVTALFGWDGSNQSWLGYFPDAVDIPGANDLTSLRYGQAYWIAIDEPDGATWTIAVDDQLVE